MSQPSRLRLDASTQLPSIHSFGELSHFLSAAGADQESRELSESMGQLAAQIEAIIAAMRVNRLREAVAPLMVDLMTVLRRHRTLVVGLDLAWRGLYEYPGYLQALNNFRVLIGQWLLDGGPDSLELRITTEDFELIAWRTLGEGMLMIDMYEQLVPRDPADESETLLAGEPEGAQNREPSEPRVERAIQWWKKLRL